MTEPLSSVLDRAAAYLGPDTGADVRAARALLRDALLQAGEMILGSRRVEPVTIEQMDELDKMVCNIVLRAGRAKAGAGAVQRATEGERLADVGEAA